MNMASQHRIMKFFGFKKSVAHFASAKIDLYHRTHGMTTKIGPILGWVDNYDLFISSPNWMKTAVVSLTISSEILQHLCSTTIDDICLSEQHVNNTNKLFLHFIMRRV